MKFGHSLRNGVSWKEKLKTKTTDPSKNKVFLTMSEYFGRLILVYKIHEVIIQHTNKVLQNFNPKNRQLCNLITHGSS